MRPDYTMGILRFTLIAVLLVLLIKRKLDSGFHW